MASPTRFGIIFDSHGDMVDPVALRVARSFFHTFKPDIRIHGGDIFDFRWLRSGASNEEKMEAVNADFDAGRELLGWWKPTHVLWGNHDHRLWRAAESPVGSVKALAHLLIDQIADCVPGADTRVYCKRQGVLQLGDFRIVHGFAAGENALATHMRAYGSVIHGHNHCNEARCDWSLDGHRGYSIGCLSQLDLGYNNAHIRTLRQQHGFAYGFLTSSGRLIVHQAYPIAGEWFIPTEFQHHADCA